MNRALNYNIVSKKVYIAFALCAVICFSIPQNVLAEYINPAGTTITNTTGTGLNAATYNATELTNNGTIDVTGSSTYGIFGYFSTSTPLLNYIINNTGSITASGTSSTYGIHLGGRISATILNSGVINSTSQGYTTTGINAVTDGINIINSGSINLTSSPSGGAYGINAIASHASILNSGTINIDFTHNSNAGIQGIYAKSYDDTASTVVNDGDININITGVTSSAGGQSYGINAEKLDIINNGNIIINAGQNNIYGLYSANTSPSIEYDVVNNGSIQINNPNNAYGVYLYGNNTLKTNFENNGDITITNPGISKDAMGVYSQFIKNTSITNSGTINITRTSSTGGAETTGIWVESRDSSNINNSGSINIKSTDSGIGIVLYNTQASSVPTVYNSGSINVSATNAYGIYLPSSANPSTVSNIGKMTLIGTTTYEVYSHSSFNILDYGVTLKPTINQVIGLDDTINDSVNFINGTVYASPASFSEGFQFNVDFPVVGMVGTLNTSGGFANAKATNPFLSATLTGSDLQTQTVRLSLDVKDSVNPALASSNYSLSSMHSRMHTINSQLFSQALFNATKNTADTSVAYNNDTILDNYPLYASNTLYNLVPTSAKPYADYNKQWEVFVTPHATFVNNDNLNYEAKNYGLAAGFTYKFSEDTSTGIHADFSFADTEKEEFNLNSDIFSASLGLHATHFISDSLYTRGNITALYSGNTLNYSLSGNVGSEEKFTDYSLYAGVYAGYIMNFMQNNYITPELGLNYLYTRNASYNLEFPTSPSENFKLDPKNYSAFYASLALRYDSEFLISGFGAPIHSDAFYIRPMASIGLRQYIAGSDVVSTVTLFGTQATTVGEEDKTAFTTSLGFELANEIVALRLIYDGEFSKNQSNHNGQAMIRYSF